MTLPMTLIIVTGEIDLSVASILGMSSALVGDLYSHGWPMPLVIAVVLVVGAARGLRSTDSSSRESGCRRSPSRSGR